MILKLFFAKYVHCNGLKLSGVLEELSITSRFLGSKIQKSFFFKISVLSAVFIEFKYRCLKLA